MKPTTVGYRVYLRGEHPKKKRQFYDGIFKSRQQARSFCRNRMYSGMLYIVHPDGTEELYAENRSQEQR